MARRLFGMALVAALAGGAGVFVGAWLERRDQTDLSPSELPVQAEPGRQTPLPALDVAAVAAQVVPSVVAVQATGDPGSGRASTGTGVVLTADGEILTNAHVVEGAERVAVRFAGETEPRDAEVVGIEPESDLALLRVVVSGSVPARFAAAGDVAVGDQALAVGFALDLDGEPSVTQGIVSALDRTLVVTDEVVLTDLIQTDAAISSGNSGGPLVNSAGEVIGINTLVADIDSPTISANGLAFAISNRTALAAIDRMRAGTSAGQGFFGVQLEQRFDGGSGALVTEVIADSPAAQAGVEVGDVVVAVNGEPIEGEAALVATIRGNAVGSTVVVDLVRDGQPITVEAVLVERPSE
jgi:S1-C subfamily serine protease